MSGLELRWEEEMGGGRGEEGRSEKREEGRGQLESSYDLLLLESRSDRVADGRVC